MKRTISSYVAALILLFSTFLSLKSQTAPSREYVRLNGRVIAVETPGPVVTLNETGATAPLTGTPVAAPFQVTAPSGVTWNAAAQAGQTWLTVASGAAGSGNGTVTWSAMSNAPSGSTPTTQRNATITVSGAGFTALVYTVTQNGSAANPTFTLTAITPLSLGASQSTGSLSVDSTVSSTVVSNAGWLTINAAQATGTGPRTVGFEYATNNGASRDATVQLMSGGTPRASLTYSQAASPSVPDFISLVTSYSSGTQLPSPAFSYTVTVNSNGAWSVTSQPSWITIQNGSGSNGQAFTFSAGRNYGASQRSGTITVTKGSASQQINVIQNAVASVRVVPDSTSGPPVQVAPGSTYQVQISLDGVVDDSAVSQGLVSWSLQNPTNNFSINSTSGLVTAPWTENVGVNVNATFTPRGLTSNNQTTILTTVSAVPTPISVTFNPATGSGATFVSTYQYLGSGGGSSLGQVRLIFDLDASNMDCWINTQSGNSPPIYIDVTTPANSIPGYSGYVGQGPPITRPGICGLIPASSSVSTTTYTRIVTTPVTFYDAPSGPRQILAQASTVPSIASFYIPMGTYTVVPVPTVSLVNPTTGLGSSATFVADFSFPDGAASMNYGDLLISGASPNTANACLVRYKRGPNTIHLLQDNGTTEGTGYAPGTSTMLQNTQCSINLASATVALVSGGSAVRLTVPVSFKTAFTGSRVTYLRGVSSTSDSTYQSKGNWTVDEIPSGVSVTPSSGSGSTQTFSFVFGDPNGYSDLAAMNALIGTSAATGCAVDFNPSSGLLSLIGTSGTIAPGSGSLTNGRCTLSGAGSSVSASGTTRTVNAALTFAAGFAGTYNVSLYARDAAGAEQMSILGTWNTATASPTLNPPAGTYTDPQNVTINGTGSIYYTTNGSTPTAGSTLYTGTPVPVSSSLTLKAIAIVGGSSSAVTSASYTIGEVSAPTFSPGEGTYTAVQSVTISTTTPGASIYYTTNGNTPTTSSSLYTGPVSVGSSMTLKALAVKNGYTNSAVTSAAYVINLGPGWYNTSWTRRKLITIDHTKVAGGSNLTDFPMLFSRDSDSALAASARVDGRDILFTASDGVTKLPHELELYTSSTGKIVAWVKAPTLSTSTDVQVFMYYGNASATDQQNKTAVWNSSYVGVWHLAELSGTTISDSTSNANNGTRNASAYPFSPAKVGDGQLFGTASGNTQVSADAEFNTNTITFQAWVNATASATWRRIFQSSPSLQTAPMIVNSSGSLWMRFQNVEYYMGSLPNAQWTHLAFTYDGTTPVMYVNGQNVTLTVGSNGLTYQPASSYIFFGSRPDGASSLDGKMDEIRMLNSARSAGWIATEYNNQNSPSTFYTVGSEQFGTPADPTFSLPAGTYTGTQNVTISGTGSIYYTTNGSTPTSSSTLYTGTPVSMASSLTLKAIAVSGGTSGVTSAAYTIVLPVANPTFNSAAGTYDSAQSVTISTTTSGATIYYTTNGSTPTTASTVYSNPVSVASSSTLKAIAVKSGMADSAVSSASYAIQAATPTFTPGAGTYTAVQSVTISTTTPGTTIYYTTNGSTPTTSSTLYTGPVSVGSSMTLKALTVKSGIADSNVGTAAYVINLGPGWYSTSWAHRKLITIDHTKVSGGSNLTDFPILFSRDSDSAIAASARTDGRDILFTSSDGVTKLPHEIELYSSSTGKIVAWVKMPTLSPSTDGQIFVYYGNASAADQQNKTAVWNSSYVGIWHLSELSGTTISDSTSNANNGTRNASAYPFSPAKVGDGQRFGTTSGNTQVTADSEFNTNAITFQAWVNASPSGEYSRIFVSSPSLQTAPVIVNSYGTLKMRFKDVEYVSGSIANSQWTHLTFTYDGTTPLMYINGQNAALNVGYAGLTYWPASNYIFFGSRPDGLNSLDGKMDEIRMLNSVRSAGWIATEYNNQNSPSTFYAVGGEQ